MQVPHLVAEPSILYFGTPVVLISTVNEDGSANLAPFSSAWWLGWRCMVGLGNASKTAANLRRGGECVVNLPSERQVAAVDRLARLTGADPVPEGKRQKGYVHRADKFAAAGLTPLPAATVTPPRVLECPVQLEAVLMARHDLNGDDPAVAGALSGYELRITRVHLHPEILKDGTADRIDPDKWRPLIMSFQKFYGLAPGQLQDSRLSAIDEALYRMPDIDRARREAGRRDNGARR